MSRSDSGLISIRLHDCRSFVRAKGISHMTSGVLVEGDDWEKMGEGILGLLRDRSLAARLGFNAKECIRGTLDWKTIIRRIEGRYASVMEGR